MTRARAALLRSAGTSPRTETITLREPGPRQVRVRLAASGVCHSDLSLANGTFLQQFPAVLGHEGSGTVVEVGDGAALRPGDRVVLNWSPSCGTCWFCTHEQPYLCVHAGDAAAIPYATLDDGAEVYPGLGVAAFASETVVDESACVPIPDDVPLQEAALLGCAVLTGVGAVLNAARVQPGQSVVVMGLGGVGLSAVQGARIAGADPIIAVDPSEAKADVAHKAGATLVLQPSRELGKQVRERTEGRGADHAIECAGRAEAVRSAWSVTRRGGTATIVGMGARTDSVSFNALELPHFARTIIGCFFGNSDPARDIPVLVEHMRAGRLNLDVMVSRRVSLDDLESAFQDLDAGRGARTLVVHET